MKYRVIRASRKKVADEEKKFTTETGVTRLSNERDSGAGTGTGGSRGGGDGTGGVEKHDIETGVERNRSRYQKDNKDGGDGDEVGIKDYDHEAELENVDTRIKAVNTKK
jgi:hypothetical protein